ncbi:hypothetical protein H9P43_006010 [Blastocladiella emersonii ATCC 22665]|nr:hypothetical protein H9P43_006010 [Blastocladiella emersonii ATCC 22665]
MVPVRPTAPAEMPVLDGTAGVVHVHVHWEHAISRYYCGLGLWDFDNADEHPGLTNFRMAANAPWGDARAFIESVRHADPAADLSFWVVRFAGSGKTKPWQVSPDSLITDPTITLRSLCAAPSASRGEQLTLHILCMKMPDHLAKSLSPSPSKPAGPAAATRKSVAKVDSRLLLFTKIYTYPAGLHYARAVWVDAKDDPATLLETVLGPHIMATCTCRKLLFKNPTGIFEEKGAQLPGRLNPKRSWRAQRVKFGSIIVLEFAPTMAAECEAFELECFTCEYHRGADLKDLLDTLHGQLDNKVIGRMFHNETAPLLPGWAVKSLLRRVDPPPSDGWHVVDELCGMSTPDMFRIYVQTMAANCERPKMWICSKTEPAEHWLKPIKTMLASSIISVQLLSAVKAVVGE